MEKLGQEKWEWESMSPKERADAELGRKVIEILREKWGEDRQCPYCGAIEWQVGKLMHFPLWAQQAAFPAVPVTCINCANTTFVNPLSLGLDLPAGDEESGAS